jgi:hypothetical protein
VSVGTVSNRGVVFLRMVCRVDAVCVLLELLSPANSTMHRGPRPPFSEHYAFLYSRPHVSENGVLGFKVVWQRTHHKVRQSAWPR